MAEIPTHRRVKIGCGCGAVSGPGQSCEASILRARDLFLALFFLHFYSETQYLVLITMLHHAMRVLP